MYCPKCGDPVEQDEVYCNKCGTFLQNNIKQNSSNTHPQSLLNSLKIDHRKSLLIGIGAGLGCVLFLFLCLIGSSNGKYYFSGNSYENSGEIGEDTHQKKETTKRSKYSTVIITDNTYSGVKISQKKDAYELIAKDSVSQKNKCPDEIKSIENDMIKNYGIAAVNLCEMNVAFARELGNVFGKIYKEYKGARGYLTNLSLTNVPMSEGYIAAFMPVFNFATSNSSTTYPWIIKTQVLLNTSYFLNQSRLEASVTDGSTSGHFPPHATIYSPVAHELGHYLSFLAMMKYYKLNSILLVDNSNIDTFYKTYADFGEGNFSFTMIKEAYEHYKRDTNTTETIDEWRATISNYAVTKDNSGNYIYDETIAEAFHDTYLNGVNAKDASKYIVNVLKDRLGG